jgi:hypothetical protein
MTLKTRWFGKKVKGDALVSLISTLGEDPNKLLQASGERWTTESAHGRVGFTPTKEGVNVDLYVFRKDYHIIDGTIPGDNSGSLNSSLLYTENPLFSVAASDNRTIQLWNHHIQGEIKYPINESKVKSGTGTGVSI